MTTEQAHSNLKNVLLNGRILLNGLPLTANEISALLQGEQMLFEKAMKLDKASELVAKREIPTKLPPIEKFPEGAENIVKFPVAGQEKKG